VLYLVFNEGYAATAGDDWMRPALCEDAMRLGRVLAELMPGEPEVHGLVALMELQASRAAARTGRDGAAILPLEQKRALPSSHLLPSVRADLLARLGRNDEARTELARAASLTRNARERALLVDRADKLPR